MVSDEKFFSLFLEQVLGSQQNLGKVQRVPLDPLPLPMATLHDSVHRPPVCVC